MLTFQVEIWAALRDEVVPLASAHWEEMPFDPDLPLRRHEALYEALGAKDGLLIVTGRDNGRLVGYFINFVSRHPHYDLLTAAMDVYFLAPEYRSGSHGLLLFRAMEDACRERGVEYMLSTARLDRSPGAAAVLKRLGWAAVRTVYEKRMGKKHG